MKKKLIISDIHSNIKALNYLKTTEYWNDPNTEVWFTGDYIDGFFQDKNSGLDVLNFVKKAVESGKAKAIMGNHDDFLLYSLKGNIMDYKQWFVNGGRTSLNKGFGISDTRFERFLYKFETQYSYILPFLESLPLTLSEGNLLISHAGFDLSLPIKEQTRDFLTWARAEYYEYDTNIKLLHPDYIGKTIITGHTPTSNILRNQDDCILLESSDVYLKRYYIDGGSKGSPVEGVITHLNCIVFSESMKVIDNFAITDTGEKRNSEIIEVKLTKSI